MNQKKKKKAPFPPAFACGHYLVLSSTIL